MKSRAAMPPVRSAGIVGCVALGVATALYGLGMAFLSGHRVADLVVRDERAIRAGALSLSPGQPTISDVGPVTLDPAMNPIRVVMHATYPGSYRGRAVTARVALKDGEGRRPWIEDCQVVSGCRSSGGSSHNSSASVVLATFDVSRADRYSFDVALYAPSGDPTRRVTLEVRRNVASVNRVVLWAGAGAAIASLLVGLIGGLFRRDEPGAGPVAA